jgi:arabinan endo-1,5-alpha-L-arabinosidase
VSSHRLVRGVGLMLAGLALLTANGAGATAAPTAVSRAAHANPQPVRGPAATHDPSMIRLKDGSWEVFATHYGIEIYRSRDRVHWHYTGQALPDGVDWAGAYQPADAPDLWAPDVSLHHGTYFLYYAVSSFGSNMSAIGLATSRSGLPGHWTDHGLVYASSPSDDFNAIDPGLLVDGRGRWWLTLGSFWSGIKEIRVDPATGKPRPGAPLRALAQRPAPPDAIEGAYLVRHRGRYYLFASYDFCCQGLNSTYNIRVGRSTSPRGPFHDRSGRALLDGGGTKILATHGNVIGPGGQSVIRIHHRDYLVYHYYNVRDAGTPRLGMNRLAWQGAGPESCTDAELLRLSADALPGAGPPSYRLSLPRWLASEQHGRGHGQPDRHEDQAGDHIAEVMGPEVQPSHPHQRWHRDQRHADPSPPAWAPAPDEHRQRAVQGDRGGDVARRVAVARVQTRVEDTDGRPVAAHETDGEEISGYLAEKGHGDEDNGTDLPQPEPGGQQEDRTEAQHRHRLTEESDGIGYPGERARSVPGEPSLQAVVPMARRPFQRAGQREADRHDRSQQKYPCRDQRHGGADRVPTCARAPAAGRRRRQRELASSASSTVSSAAGSASRRASGMGRPLRTETP